MRCQACNKNLNDYEATRKTEEGYVDLCNKCFKGLGIKATVRDDLEPNEEPPEDFDDLADKFIDEYAEEEEDYEVDTDSGFVK